MSHASGNTHVFDSLLSDPATLSLLILGGFFIFALLAVVALAVIFQRGSLRVRLRSAKTTAELEIQSEDQTKSNKAESTIRNAQHRRNVPAE